MRRDKDKIYKILKAFESKDMEMIDVLEQNELGLDSDQIDICIGELLRTGYTINDVPAYKLTWKGHDFIEAFEDRWNCD